MSGASFAVVRPRVISPQTGETLLLEDVVATHLAAGDRGVIQICGDRLMGKTTAIEYLDRFFAGERDLALLDLQARLQFCVNQTGLLTISTLDTPSSIAKYQLTPWGQDEWIEYLLAAHKSRCGSVMARLRTPQSFAELAGNPGLWRLVLEELAANESISSASEALRWAVIHLFAEDETCEAMRNFALVASAPLLVPMTDELDREARALAELPIKRDLFRLLALDSVCTILAGDALASRLHAGDFSHLQRKIPPALLAEVASTIKHNDGLQLKLDCVLASDNIILHAMAASLLHVAGIGWMPTRQAPGIHLIPNSEAVKLPDLSNAYLVEADWPGIDLRCARLLATQLRGANLKNANLEGAHVVAADLSGANLQGASLASLNANSADLSRADLSFARAACARLEGNLTDANLEGALLTKASFREANLTRACFVRANLSGAQLNQADITEADFTQANLHGSYLNGLDLRLACFDFAILSQAQLRECNLEFLKFPGADFAGANLSGAYLTGSQMSQANLSGANLQGAGLADVEWEGVDLSCADLRGASFHLGSTRCGLVGSPYPSHGTRTGFYTDDYNEQDFKSPEEIRKANLCGADLRGANIEGVDFYLVDVRDAKYDQYQLEHLRLCGAILKAKAV